MDDVLTTTLVWKPIADLQKQHQDAILELSAAAGQMNMQAMKAASDKITYIEYRQRLAAVNARKYALSKVRHG